MLESRLMKTKDGEKYVDGYFLTLDQLQQLILTYLKDDCGDKISNDQLYIMRWIDNNKI